MLDNLPDYANPEMLYRLYGFLNEHVEPHPSSAFYDAPRDLPTVIMFVDDNVAYRFPQSTEGFAGMSGLARWDCRPAAVNVRQCQLRSTAASSVDEHTVLLAVVNDGMEQKETMGVLAHELAHLLGAVDGPRCPAHEAYNPAAHLATDLSDTYWWYGVSGVFTLTPSGLVWDALSEHCSESDAPSLCYELEAILSLAA